LSDAIDLAVKFPDDQPVPALGQGTWRMGERRAELAREVATLRLGIELGLSVIDTAEMYGDGGAESVVGEAIRDCREQVFLISKVYPHHGNRRNAVAACQRSLDRLRCETLDLYLLHWRGNIPLSETIEAFEQLREEGRILRWGVSNFDVADLLELDDVRCAGNQVLYHLGARGIEFDLLPWCRQRGMPVMAYSPLGQAGALLRHPALLRCAQRHGATPAQIALAWVLSRPGVIAIPKSSNTEHLRANAAAARIALRAEDLAELDAAFPPPTRKQRLGML
jgi:diketogulonate reductase-like aldo/keto reductase